MRGQKLDDVLAVSRLSAAQLRDVTLPSNPQNLLALLTFAVRHADHRACVVCLFPKEVCDEARREEGSPPGRR